MKRMVSLLLTLVMLVALPVFASADGDTIRIGGLAPLTGDVAVYGVAAQRGVDLYDPAVRARPWPGVRALIFSLLESDTRLRAALRR